MIVSPDDRAEIIALLVDAYDHLEDLTPDPEFEEPDDDLEDWLSRAGVMLQRLTGEAARVLVDRKLKLELSQ